MRCPRRATELPFPEEEVGVSPRSVSVLALGDDSRSMECWMPVGKVLSVLGLMVRGCRMLGTCEGGSAERASEIYMYGRGEGGGHDTEAADSS